MEILTTCPSKLITDPNNVCPGPTTDHRVRGGRISYQCPLSNAICERLLTRGTEEVKPPKPPVPPTYEP